MGPSIFVFLSHPTQNLLFLNLDLHVDLYWMTLYDAALIIAFAGEDIPWPTPPEH